MAVSLQVRCVDAAREAARAVARGGQASSVLVPKGAVLTVEQRDGLIFAQVQADTAVPGLTVSADAVAALEPGELP